MSINRSAACALVVLAGLTAAAGVVSAQGLVRPNVSAASYFPLRAGNRWVYEKRGGGGAETWKVEVTAPVAPTAARPYFSLAGYFFGPPRVVRSDANGLVMESGGVGVRDYLWYMLGAPVGTAWQLQLAPQPTLTPVADCVNGSKLVVASRDEIVKVPAGEFHNVVRIDFRSPCKDAGITSEWFAPGVGLVRREETSIAGALISELVAAQLGELILPILAFSTALTLDSPHYVNNLMPPIVPGSLPVVYGAFALGNATDTPLELIFSGCQSMSLTVRNEAGDVVVEASANDGGCCTCANLVHVTLQRSALVLPFSLQLATAKGGPLPDGRYGVTSTLDTRGAAGLRPSSCALIEVSSVH